MRGVKQIKFAAGLAATIILRLPQAVPNIEPIMAFALPYSKAYGALAGFLFALVSILSFDFISGRVGLWTLYTGIAYGAIGFFAALYFKTRSKRVHYAAYSLTATIAYDAFTAFFFGLQFNQPLLITFLGQIPFTLYHVAGNVSFSTIFSPMIYKHVLAEPEPVPGVVPDARETIH